MDENKENLFDTQAARKSIENAQKAGSWPKLQENPIVPETTPPFVPGSIDQNTGEPKRTHEEAMQAFHKVVKEYEQIKRQEEIQLQTPRPLAIEPEPIPKKESVLKRFSNWISGNSRKDNTPPPITGLRTPLSQGSTG
jgi:hypothetical protein